MVLFSAFYRMIFLGTLMFNAQASATEKIEEFGEKIGSNRGVVAYSNLGNDFVSKRSNFIKRHREKHFSGMKWQCVEYARRWLMEVRGITFEDVDYAVNIPSVRGFLLDPDKKKEVMKIFYYNELNLDSVYHNGRMPDSIQVGDLLIYSTNYAKVTGHVAVVVKIDKSHIYIGEQNQANAKWQGRNYARRIPFTKSGDIYHVQEPEITGWVRFYIA